MGEQDNDTNHPDNKKLSGENWSSLKEKKRSCTDCLCLLLIIAAWVAMTAIGFVVTGIIEDDHLNQGNPARLTNAIDYKGRICGDDDDVASRPNAYYLVTGAVVCVKSCPKSTDFESFYCMDGKQAAADANLTDAWTSVSKGECMWRQKTTEVINRCIYENDKSAGDPKDEADEYIGDDALEHIPKNFPDSGDGTSSLTGFFADVYAMRGYIFGFGIGVALFLAFGYLYFLRIPGMLFTIIWTIIISIFVALLVGSFLLWDMSNKWEDDGEHKRNEYYGLRIISYIGFGATALYFCLVLVLRKRIMLAINIIKEAARALAAMPILSLFPVFQTLGLVLFLVPWVIYCLYLGSSGKITIEKSAYGTEYRTFTYDDNTRYAALYMLFCWFWTSQFIIAIGQLVIALGIACWYFVRDKKEVGNFTVIWAFKAVVFNHLGTAAFGSLIIAIIKTIRAVLTYLQKKASKSGNTVLKFFLACLQCVMWCVEKIMKFINKNGYIVTAIYGYSFCKACRTAFFLIARNILRIMAISLIGDFVLFLGKIFVPIATVFLCYIFMAYVEGNEKINGFIGPLILVFVVAYFISCMFTEIFGMCIDTMMLCYIADEEMFPPEKRFADGSLKSSLQKTQQAAVATKVAPNDDNMKNAEKDEVLL